MAAALAAEPELGEEALEQQQDDGGGAAVAVAAKPKKGKAALLLKRDRVCVVKIVSFWTQCVFWMCLSIIKFLLPENLSLKFM